MLSLREAVDAVVAIVRSDGTHPGSNLVQLKGDGSHVVVSAFDGHRSATARADHAFKGCASVDGKHLARALAKMGSPTLKLADKKLTLSGQGKLSLATSDHDLPAARGVDGVKVDGPAFRAALERVRYAMSPDESRAHVHCVGVEPDGHFVATDGGTLAAATGPKDLRAMIPAALVPMIAATKGVELVIECENRFAVTDGHVTFACPKLDATFPPWRQVIPAAERMKLRASVQKKALLDAIGVVELTGENYLRIESGPSGLVADSSDEKTGADSSITIEAEGKLRETFVSTRLLAEAAKFVAGDVVHIDQGDGDYDPILVTGAEPRDQAIVCVMPLNMAGRKARGGKR